MNRQRSGKEERSGVWEFRDGRGALGRPASGLAWRQPWARMPASKVRGVKAVTALGAVESVGWTLRRLDCRRFDGQPCPKRATSDVWEGSLGV